MQRLTPHKLKEKVRELYSNSLELGNIDFVYTDSNITVTCKIHKKTFSRKRKALLAGKGCPDCAADRSRAERKSTFLEEARKMHNGKYGYSKVQYYNSKTPVIIICQKDGHGEFEQLPEHHKRGSGCPKCAGTAPMNNNWFIHRACEIHGDYFDYSRIQVIDARTKITIGCPQGHWFKQSPTSHLAGNKCLKCVGLNRTTDDFIEDAEKIHGDRYDYNCTKYISAKEKVVIRCKEHGDFPQNPSDHLQGSGCPRCGGTLRVTEEDFLRRANEKHERKYDYSQFKFQDYMSHGVIICPRHGAFQQSPKNHLGSNTACPDCRNKVNSSRQRRGKENFVRKARKVHGDDRYNYDNIHGSRLAG